MNKTEIIRAKLVDLEPGESRVISGVVVRKPRNGDTYRVGSGIRTLEQAVQELVDMSA